VIGIEESATMGVSAVRRRCGWCSAVVLALVLAGAGCEAGGARSGAVVVRDPWRSAGVAHPQVTSRLDDGLAVVRVEALTTLPIGDQADGDAAAGFGERVAKIAWRTHRGRLDLLEVTSGEHGADGGRHNRRWSRADLQHRFGPRPAGLDQGQPASQLEPGAGPYRDARADRLEPATGILRDVIAVTARDRYAATPPGAGRDRSECYGGLLGDKPTGTYRDSLEAEIVVPGGRPAEATLAELAGYWSARGLQVDTDELDTGLATLRAKVPTVGQVLAEVGTGAPGTTRLSAVTECHRP
jgi:hypothetical protein